MQTHPLRVRTLTAGVPLTDPADLAPIESAIDFLAGARRAFEDAGYEVQTTRIATSPQPFAESSADELLVRLQSMDRLLGASGVVASIGPLLRENDEIGAFPDWAGELTRTTRSINFSVAIASDRAVHGRAAMTAARTMVTLARVQPQGLANFRFAAAANIPAGTPFFPVAWHAGAPSLAIGTESAGIVEEAFQGAATSDEASGRLSARMTDVLKPVEEIAAAVAARAQRAYIGIDVSPAPALDRSIAAAIEAFTRTPFGAAGTLEACAAVTAGIKAVDVRTCGYSGLMLPVLEDPLLASRAGEARFGIRDLLLYSTVCGIGLDVVPIPDDAPPGAIAALLRDVASLSVRLRKPLSARLLMVPGKRAGDIVQFDDPLLTESVVLPLPGYSESSARSS